MVSKQIRHLQDLQDKSPGDEVAIEALLSAMRGGAETERQRGTLLNYLASVSQVDKPGKFYVSGNVQCSAKQ